MGIGPSELEKPHIQHHGSSPSIYAGPRYIKDDEDVNISLQKVPNGNMNIDASHNATPGTQVPSQPKHSEQTHVEPPHYWDQGVPTVFAWNKGGKAVYLAGNFNEWKEKIQMRQSRNDFFSIQNLPPGIYNYRFIVDGKWQVDPTQPILNDVNGEMANVVEVRAPDKSTQFSTKSTTGPASPPGDYGQFTYNDQTFKDSPPALPPHLLRALLNTAPPHADPQLLPLPHHVMLNHLYRIPRIEDKMLIVGVTSRYKSKFVTTVLYQPLENDHHTELSPPYPSPIPSPLSLSGMKLDSSDQLQQLDKQ